MDPETTQAILRVDGRVDKTNEVVLKLTEQVSRVVGAIETQASEPSKPSLSFMQQRFIIEGLKLVTWAILGLFVYFWTHSMHGHVPQ